MLKIKPKSPELLQAQVADFASEKLDAREDREETVGLIGKGALAGWVQTNESSHYSEYHRHLIESRRAGAETIQTRTEMLENYKHFASIIGPVEEGDVIGHGNHSAVHVIEDEGARCRRSPWSVTTERLLPNSCPVNELKILLLRK